MKYIPPFLIIIGSILIMWSVILRAEPIETPPVERNYILLNNQTVFAYTSRVEETDLSPFTMANNERVFDGAIANNCTDFGTRVEVNGKEYIVSDKMNSRWGCDVWDIWMSDLQEAKNFGKQLLTIKLYE